MPEQIRKKRKPLFILKAFQDCLELWVTRITIPYRKLLLLLALIVTLYTGMNSTSILEWLNTLLALLGG